VLHGDNGRFEKVGLYRVGGSVYAICFPSLTSVWKGLLQFGAHVFLISSDKSFVVEQVNMFIFLYN
jgi:hypothetical protein